MKTNIRRIVLLALFPNKLLGCGLSMQQILPQGASRQTRATATSRKLMGVVCLAAAIMFSGCSITKSVKPVPVGTKIQTIHVIENDDVLYKQSLLDELLAIIRSQGCEAISVRGEKPKEAVHHLTYRANWAWDLAMYLTYFRATLYEGERVLGEVEYDARSGGGRMDKFGPTADKVRPLMLELLKNVERPGGSPVVEVSPEKEK